MANRICSVDDCEEVHYGRGFCNRHYALWRRNGSPAKVKVRGMCGLEGCDAEHYGKGLCRRHWLEARRASAPLCQEDQCEDRAETRGWCVRHYTRWKRHGDPRRQSEERLCSIADCGGKHKASGYCLKHYTRFLRYGDPFHVSMPRQKIVVSCGVTWCDEDAYCRGFCRNHYARLRNHGDPTHRYPWEWVNDHRICPRCGKDTPREEWARPWCRPCKSEYMLDRGHRRRVLLAEAAQGPAVLRREIFDRDDWTCQLCGLEIYESSTYPDPDSPSIDHIVPLSRGGAHSQENVQAAHLICNQMKHNKTA